MVALITEELLLPWMCWYMPFKVSALFERRCTLVATEWFFHLNVWACVSWDNQLRRMNSCTDHRWNASPLNAVLTCVVWGDSFVWRMTYTECKLMLFPLSEWERASWSNLLLCRWEAALVAFVSFLYIRMDLVEFGHFENFWLLIYVFSVCWGLQSIGITECGDLARAIL